MTNSDPQIPPKPEGFWRRQFSTVPTRAQINFDIVFGIVAPTLCVVFDPIIFRSTPSLCIIYGQLENIAPFAYTAITLGIIVLTIWIKTRRYTGKSSVLFAGIFFAGTIFALAVGIIALPTSIFGLIVMIGLFGFTPFLTAFVYLRNGIRAWHYARQQTPPRSLPWLTVIALTMALIVFGIAALVQWQSPLLFPQMQITARVDPCATQ